MLYSSRNASLCASAVAACLASVGLLYVRSSKDEQWQVKDEHEQGQWQDEQWWHEREQWSWTADEWEAWCGRGA